MLKQIPPANAIRNNQRTMKRIRKLILSQTAAYFGWLPTGVLQVSSDRDDQIGAKIQTPKNP